MTRVAVALIHYPCLDKHGEIYATSITNLDVHDIARASTTNGVNAFYVVTPISAQRTMATAIAKYWEEGAGRKRNPDRTTAMKIVHVVSSVAEAIEAETQVLGDKPCIVFGSWRKPRPIGTTHRLIWHKKGRKPVPVGQMSR